MTALAGQLSQCLAHHSGRDELQCSFRKLDRFRDVLRGHYNLHYDDLERFAVRSVRRLISVARASKHAIVDFLSHKSVHENFWHCEWFDESFVAHEFPRPIGCYFYSNSNLSGKFPKRNVNFRHSAIARMFHLGTLTPQIVNIGGR